MLLPRPHKYSSTPPTTPVNKHKPSTRDTSLDSTPATTDSRHRSHALTRPPTPPQNTHNTMHTPSQPVDVPSPEKKRLSGSKTVGHARGRATGQGRKRQAMPEQHKSEAISPSVAALLAMTTIPRRPRQTQRRSCDKRQVSIDELVNSWRSDDSLVKSYESSPLSVLLENADGSEDGRSCSLPSGGFNRCRYERSESSDSIPSLESDKLSVFSSGSPMTPGSLRSRKSSMMVRKEAPRFQPIRESCVEDHPLISIADAEEDGFDFSPNNNLVKAAKPRSSFKSNLTTSLQALKTAALSPFAPRKITSAPDLRSRRASGKSGRAISVAPLSEEVLWSHPFLFPQFSSEVRPDYKGTPTSAQRRYFNPLPLSFEEQEAPFQQALHAPYLEEQNGSINTPPIQMQTYSRSGGRGKGKGASKKVQSDSEADPAEINAAVTAAMRQREPRENSDFLRVVVLEMNMRREGKLEMGRAKIWLPPRQASEGGMTVQGRVPKRWVGESAE